MIPRVIHQIWVGRPMPAHLDAYRATWAEHHPTWEYRLWTDADFGWLRNQQLFDLAERYTRSAGQFRADVARYEILLHYGGVYVDVDFECCRPLDLLLEDVECFAAWELDDVWVNNAILGTVADHPMYEELVDELPTNVSRHRLQRPNVMTGPQFLTPICRRHPEVTVFGSALFYPYSWRHLERRHEDFPDAYAIHRWENQLKRRRARG